MTGSAARTSITGRAWRLIWEPTWRGRSLLGILTILIAALCGPIGFRLLMASMVAPLPKALSPVASILSFPVAFLFMLAYASIIVLAPVYSCMAILRKAPRGYLPFALLALFVSVVSLPISWHISFGRNWGLERITERAQPLIEAIESYEATEGAYPPDLQALVPGYIEEIPYTGAVGYPDFRYGRATTESRFTTYEVYVSTSLGLLNFDTLVYWPEKGYPSRMYGGRTELINGWAYVHE